MSPNELNTTLTPHSIIPGDACFAYFNKNWGIPFSVHTGALAAYGDDLLGAEAGEQSIHPRDDDVGRLGQAIARAREDDVADDFLLGAAALRARFAHAEQGFCGGDGGFAKL